MQADIKTYHGNLSTKDRAICEKLHGLISANLPDADSKVWHAHPVWFLNGNPIVGYSKQKAGLRLMFWSGADFDEPDLVATKGKFKDASVFYSAVSEVNEAHLINWLAKSRLIQWDYKNIVRRKGKLEKLKQDVL